MGERTDYSLEKSLERNLGYHSEIERDWKTEYVMDIWSGNQMENLMGM